MPFLAVQTNKLDLIIQATHQKQKGHKTEVINELINQINQI